MQNRHFFRFPARARYLAEVDSAQAIQALLDRHGELMNPSVIGSGSNVLFTDFYDGWLLHPTMETITHQRLKNNEVILSVGSGVDWDHCVQYAVARGWSGLERLSLIPGTVGAAPVQNIGAYGGQLSDVLDRCETVNCLTGEMQEWGASDCQFAYRDSIFKQKRNLMIVSVSFRLRMGMSEGALYKDVESLRLERGMPASLSPKQHRDLIVAIRQRKIPDPMLHPNAGSFFKNPILPDEMGHDFLKRWPQAVAWKVPSGLKLSAAWLIESAGYKGVTRSHVGVSSQHALVLVHDGRGEVSELVGLYQAIQAGVYDRFSVKLEPEVRLFGCTGML